MSRTYLLVAEWRPNMQDYNPADDSLEGPPLSDLRWDYDSKIAEIELGAIEAMMHARGIPRPARICSSPHTERAVAVAYRWVLQSDRDKVLECLRKLPLRLYRLHAITMDKWSDDPWQLLVEFERLSTNKEKPNA